MIASIALLACIAWLYLLVARGGFWRARERDDDDASLPMPVFLPRITAVIPARDEARGIGRSVASLLRQDYPGTFSIVVVDDHSGDGTAAAARAAAAPEPTRVTVLAAPPLQAGWTGKLAALAHGIRHAAADRDGAPDYLLLTDADIVHAPDTLRALVARAAHDRLVLASLMARLHTGSVVERALIPAFVFFFQMLYPFAWVNDARRRVAAAAGGCMLVHRESLERAGGLAAIRGELIDDCALARLLKAQGPIRLALSTRVQSTRAYRSFGEIRQTVARTAFTELRFSLWRLAATVLAMGIVFVAPPLLALAGDEAIVRDLGALAWVSMALAYLPLLRFYRLSPAWALALPAIGAVYIVLTIDSAQKHWRGRGGEWKGRPSPRTALPGSSR